MVLPANASRWATRPLLASTHQIVDLVVGALGAVAIAPVARVDAAVVQPDLGAVLDLLEDVRPGLVDEGDAVGDEHLGAEVRVAARDRRRGVDDGGDAGFDERVGGDPVEVERVEDDDVAGADAAQQSVDVAVDAGGTGDAWSRVGITRQQR